MGEEDEIHPLLREQKIRLTGTTLPRVASTLANQRAAAAAAAATQLRSPTTTTKDNPYLAHRHHHDARTPKPLRLSRPGRHAQEAEAAREAAQREQLRREVAETTKALGLDMAMVADLLLGATTLPTGDCEWWDAPFLANDGLDATLVDPPPLLPPKNDAMAPLKPLMLTKQERKKLRRIRRLAEQKEKQERIKAGLQPPEPPKLKLATLAKLLPRGDDGPTQQEAVVREAMAARQTAHLEANARRAEEASPKDPRSKWIDPNDPQVHVAVFHVTNLDQPQWRFKVRKNARQVYLTGCALSYSQSCLIIVEGSAKAIRHYQRLLLQRIKWTETNQCQLLWEGVKPSRSFRLFELKEMALELEATSYLAEHQAEHYWHLIKK